MGRYQVIWIIQGAAVGVLIYFMVDGYRAIKERKRLDRLMSEMDAKILESQRKRREYDAEVGRLMSELGRKDPRFRFTKLPPN
jgi:hypothetical protein